MALIEIEHLSHAYPMGEGGQHVALEDVSLAIEAGEFVAVLGSNGSGKSTLAKHLDALLLPTNGTCRIDGMDTKNADQVWRIRQKVGMVFQNPDNQLIAAVVEDDVAFGPENLGVKPCEIRQRVDEALAAVGMTKFRTFAPHLLSGGQKQRIAIAGALAMRTECLVFDEATAMLDPEGRAEILSIVKKLHDEQHITIVYITHFMEEAAVADRVIVLDHGKLAMDGTPREVFARADELQELGLDVPLSVELGAKLRNDGIAIPQEIVTEDDLVQALASLVPSHQRNAANDERRAGVQRSMNDKSDAKGGVPVAD